MKENQLTYLVLAISERNDESAFDELFRYYFPGLISFTSSILKNDEEAEEVVEDVFIKLWNNRNLLSTINNLSHYLYTATKHTAFNYLKKSKRNITEEMGEELSFSLITPESRLINNENVKRIEDAINNLPSRCRLIFRLVKQEGMKYSEVAKLLDISERTVNAQMTIALSKLVEALDKALPEYAGYFSRKKNG